MCTVICTLSCNLAHCHYVPCGLCERVLLPGPLPLTLAWLRLAPDHLPVRLRHACTLEEFSRWTAGLPPRPEGQGQRRRFKMNTLSDQLFLFKLMMTCRWQQWWIKSLEVKSKMFTWPLRQWLKANLLKHLLLLSHHTKIWADQKHICTKWSKAAKA